VAEPCLPAGRGLKQHTAVMFCVYILKSLKDNSLYIGKTNNLERRLAEHTSGHTQSLKSKVPLVLLEVIECRSEIEARKLEKEYKKGYKREELRKKHGLISQVR
jgi:putative endonuclease